ncbi:MAG: methylamine utilization protein [Burkholderiaceae bacterium]|nr:methylamine utilization protein [Burkholderiaceae bacterium]
MAALVCALPAAAFSLDVRDDAGRPLAGAVVFLESAQARRQLRPLAQAEMGQAGKQFVPQVLVVPVGTAVNFPNRDTVRHHVYSFSPTKKFELKLYIGTPANPVVFDRSGIAVLGCNIHDQMVGWIVVVETPYYAMTDAQGRAVIDAPPGNYRLRSWHPGLPVGAAAQDQALELGNPAQNVSVRLSGVRP